MMNRFLIDFFFQIYVFLIHYHYHYYQNHYYYHYHYNSPCYYGLIKTQRAATLFYLAHCEFYSVKWLARKTYDYLHHQSMLQTNLSTRKRVGREGLIKLQYKMS